MGYIIVEMIAIILPTNGGLYIDGLQFSTGH